MAIKEVKTVSENLTKKGVLKGKNKKETKALRGMCPHHRLNKKGKIRPTIYSADGKTFICTSCGETFPAKFFTNEEIKEIMKNMKSLNNQNKFMAVATNSGDKMVSYFCQIGVMLQSYAKHAKKIRNVAEKSGDIRKKKHKRNETGSSALGTWGTR